MQVRFIAFDDMLRPLRTTLESFQLRADDVGCVCRHVIARRPWIVTGVGA